ncbi:MAG: hypothetical protein EBZ36_13885 [Acidobacteria bacterium]|nr:hypothetical protein [Acidobacteriota bacterium]
MMKPLVNLATDPFRNRKLFWVAIFLIFAIAAAFGQQAIRQRAERQSSIDALAASVRQLELRLGKTAPPAATGSGLSLIQPEQNTRIYAASELIARKSFSWSSLLDEIEKVIPPGVRVLRIAVNTVVPEEKNGTIGGPESAATLNLEVIAKSSQEVIKLINLLHNAGDSGRFRVSPISQKPVEGTGEIEFSLRVQYFPPPMAPSAARMARATPPGRNEIKTPGVSERGRAGADSSAEEKTR